MELKTYKLADIADFNISSIGRSETFKEIIYLDTSSITDNVVSGTAIINIKEAPSRAQRKVTNNTIIYSTVRPRLKHYGILSCPQNNFIVSTGFATIDIKDSYKYKIDPRYLYLLLTQQTITNYIGNIADTAVSAYPSINPSDLSSLCFMFPDYDIQKTIADIWSNYDCKIALNRALNQNLEAMAKQLYDYWFVQFDFPNEEGKPYKSSGGAMVWNEKLKRMIPKEWTNANIYQLAGISKETVNPQVQPNELFKHYSLPEYDKTGTYAEEYGIDIQSAKFAVTNNCILVSKLNPWTSRVICGNIESNQICSTEFVVWNPASMKTKGFLFMLAKSAKFIEYCTQGATGTSHSHRRINPEFMMKFDFPYNSEIAIKFSLLIENIIEQLQNNIAQLKALTKQRDELLPLLMNGQVSVNSDLSAH